MHIFLFVLIIILAGSGLKAQDCKPLLEYDIPAYYIPGIYDSRVHIMGVAGSSLWIADYENVWLMNFDRERGLGVIDTIRWSILDYTYPIGMPDMGFFNNDTGLVIIIESWDVERKGVFRTTDAGASWAKADFEFGEYTYDLCIHSNVKAWISGDSGRIYYSDDYGLSWKKLATSPGNTERIYDIEIGRGGYGIRTTTDDELDDKIMVTSDYGESWQTIPPPCEQMAPEYEHCEWINIDKIGVAGRYGFARQAGRCFYWNMLEEKWVPFGNEVIDFTTSENGDAVIVDSALRVFFLQSPDSKRSPAPFTLPARPHLMALHDGVLSVLDMNGWFSRADHTGLISVYPRWSGLTMTASDFIDIYKYDEVLFAFTNAYIYRSGDYGNTWCPWAPVPGRIRDISVINDTTVVAFCDDGVRQVSPGGLRDLVSDIGVQLIRKYDGRIVVAGEKKKMTGKWPKLENLFHSSILLLSSDGGLHWKTVYEGRGLRPMEISFVTPDSIDAIDGREMVQGISLKNGIGDPDLVYRQRSHPDDPASFPARFLMRCGPLVAYGDTEVRRDRRSCLRTYDRVYFRTGDGGETWQRIDESEMPYEEMLRSDSGSYASKHGRLYLVGDDCDSTLIADAATLPGVSGNEQVLLTYTIDNRGDLLVVFRSVMAVPRQERTATFYLYRRERGELQRL